MNAPRRSQVSINSLSFLPTKTARHRCIKRLARHSLDEANKGRTTLQTPKSRRAGSFENRRHIAMFREADVELPENLIQLVFRIPQRLWLARFRNARRGPPTPLADYRGNGDMVGQCPSF